MERSLLSLLIIMSAVFNCYTGNCCAGNGNSKPYQHQKMHRGLSKTPGGYPTFNGLDDDDSEVDDEDNSSIKYNRTSSEFALNAKYDLHPKQPTKSILKKPQEAAAVVATEKDKQKSVTLEGDIETEIN